MEPINSGTTTERIIRTAIMVCIVVGFAIAFLWDGHAGYVRKNALALVKSLGLPPEQVPAVNQQLTAAEAKRIIDEIGERPPLDEVISWLGEPPLRHADKLYYPGPGGHLWVQLERGRVQKMGWTWADHTETDLRWQQRIGYLLSVVGLALIFHLVSVATSRITLTDAGMKMRGRLLIPYDAMTVLRTGGTRDANSVTLEYMLKGRTRVVRFDTYRVKEFPVILDGICLRAGFPHPHAPEQASNPTTKTSSEDG